MADKVKVEITGSVDFGKGPVELGVYELDHEVAKDLVKKKAGKYVNEVKAENVKKEDAKAKESKPKASQK